MERLFCDVEVPDAVPLVVVGGAVPREEVVVMGEGAVVAVEGEVPVTDGDSDDDAEAELEDDGLVVETWGMVVVVGMGS